MILMTLCYWIPFNGNFEEGLSITRDDAEDVIDVMDLQNPLSSPSVKVPPVWFWSENILPIFEPVGVTSLL